MRKIYIKNKIEKKNRLHRKIRSKISGTNEIPRLAVYRSNRYISSQLIDDNNHKTLTQHNDLKLNSKEGRIASAQNVGKVLAGLALKLGIKKVVFDRGGFSYAGRVKALAEGARIGGLEF